MLRKKEKYNVAVVGATGAVGQRMVSILEERRFPVAVLTPLASARSVGKLVRFNGADVPVRELTESSFKDQDIALFSAGASVSRKFGPLAVQAGCIVIDNSSAFRMDKDVPLVVPEVNAHAIGDKPGIIANPNCSTIQMVVALKPIHDKFRIRRIVVSTYQSVSGTGQKAIEELRRQSTDILHKKDAQPAVYPHRIAFNCLPQIDDFLDSGYTKEEMKMVNETRKIMGDDTIAVCPTTVRVPVFYAHSESVNVETEGPVTAAAVRELLAKAPGVQLMDAPADKTYPMPICAENQDAVFVGRIRNDISRAHAVNLWIVADNLRKGAALNAVQIAEFLLTRQRQ